MEEWFKLKRYPHIGRPITKKDYEWVKKYVTNPELIRRHSFLPFIYKSIVKRKYRPDKATLKRNPSGKRRRVVSEPKIRPIYYASHLESIIYSYYNWILNKSYEDYIRNMAFNDSIVAYRKVPLEAGSEKSKCNIEIAKSVFEFIKVRDDKKLSVIVADITSFFDNLDHKILKKQWCKILNVKSLRQDHYNVYKSLINIRFVKSNQFLKALNNNVIVERGMPNTNQVKELKKIKVEKLKYFREKNVVSFCGKKDFVERHLALIENLNNQTGIPQGSPISSTLANVYMLDFDSEVFSEVDKKKGYYSRYSDDLIIVCNQEHEDYFIHLIRRHIKDLACLEIKEEKTKVYRFEEVANVYRGFQINEKTKEYYLNRPLEYLGFTFDGQRVLIKSSGFSKFYRAMKRSFKKKLSLAKYSKNPDRKIFNGQLFKRFTYKGARRKLIYHPSPTDKSKYVKTTRFYWGNYISYLLKANHVMHDLNKSDAIKKQSRKLWSQFGKLRKKNQSSLEKYLKKKQAQNESKENQKTE